MIGRDHLDSGSVATPYRETEAMIDGSDAVADWPMLNCAVNTASRRILGQHPPRRRRRHRLLAARRQGRGGRRHGRRRAPLGTRAQQRSRHRVPAMRMPVTTSPQTAHEKGIHIPMPGRNHFAHEIESGAPSWRVFGLRLGWDADTESSEEYQPAGCPPSARFVFAPKVDHQTQQEENMNQLTPPDPLCRQHRTTRDACRAATPARRRRVPRARNRRRKCWPADESDGRIAAVGTDAEIRARNSRGAGRDRRARPLRYAGLHRCAHASSLCRQSRR